MAIVLAASACGDRATPAATPKATHFQGQTFAFDYPPGWHIWSQSYQDGQETVVLANIPPQTPGRGGLPSDVIKVDLYSTGDIALPIAPPAAGAQSLTFSPSNVKFFLSRGTEVPWAIQGAVRTERRLYIVSVLMTSQQPPLEAVAPILSSWRLLPP